VARDGPLPAFDFQVPLLSVPGILGTTVATIPVEVPYVFPDAHTVQRWRRELGAVRAFRIGITWQGSPKHKSDTRRSLKLSAFGPLAALEGVRLYSLQKGHGSEQLADAGLPITDLGSRLETFADTAAVLENLDLVISVDTALAHCAGALAVPVWVVLSHVPEWRWQLDREDSPWYPSMRLFRQRQLGDWDEVIARMRAALARAKSEIRSTKSETNPKP